MEERGAKAPASYYRAQNPSLGLIGSGFPLEPSTTSSTMTRILPHGVSVNAGGDGGQVKRKRGRPRKYAPDGNVGPAPPNTAASSMPAVNVGSTTPKRGRGRPPGTGSKQQLASLGEWVAGSAGMSFTPHIISIGVGEDIAAKIKSFSQQGPRVVCILSASGAVSRVSLCQSAPSGGTVTYEGRFEIICLSGSYLTRDDGQNAGLTICLSSPDGRVLGGGVGGLLIAATPVQVILGSFIYGGSKAKGKSKTNLELLEPEHEIPGDNNHENTLMNDSRMMMHDQNILMPLMGGWPVPSRQQQMNMRNPIDINLTRR